MIVKNEAHILARCLAKIRPHIDFWIIVDTGSTDDTKRVAAEALRGIPGEIHDHEWRGFGDARTRALELAEQITVGRPAYAWVVDADDVWDGELDRSQLTSAAHSVWFHGTGDRVKWATNRFFQLGKGWRYVGPVHEEPVANEPHDRPLIECMTVSSPNDGGSWRDPDKHLKHVAALREALDKEPLNTRYQFYLAQSYRDHGDDATAAVMYLQRAAMGPGSFPEEIYVSFLEAGRALMRLGRIDDAKRALLNAHQSYKERREAMAELGRLFLIKAATSPTVGTLNVEAAPTLSEEAEA
jgi:glycosyltransferase involved in cell wall biosynthesis